MLIVICQIHQKKYIKNKASPQVPVINDIISDSLLPFLWKVYKKERSNLHWCFKLSIKKNEIIMGEVNTL